MTDMRPIPDWLTGLTVVRSPCIDLLHESIADYRARQEEAQPRVFLIRMDWSRTRHALFGWPTHLMRRNGMRTVRVAALFQPDLICRLVLHAHGGGFFGWSSDSRGIVDPRPFLVRL